MTGFSDVMGETREPPAEDVELDGEPPPAEDIETRRIYLYADESGNFDFSRKEGATRYFVLTTVAFFDDRRALADLGALREAVSRELAMPLTLFHASEDRQAVRNRVFEALRPHQFRSGCDHSGETEGASPCPGDRRRVLLLCVEPASADRSRRVPPR